MANFDKWTEDYEAYTKNPPKPGAILRAYGEGAIARLDVELVENKPPFVYGRAFVPCLVGCELGWFLQAYDSTTSHGWKCILLPKAREDCLRRMGLKKLCIPIKALKVVRHSQTGNSLLCEVAEYLSKEELEALEPCSIPNNSESSPS